jgi:hypothetical protein
MDNDLQNEIKDLAEKLLDISSSDETADLKDLLMTVYDKLVLMEHEGRIKQPSEKEQQKPAAGTDLENTLDPEQEHIGEAEIKEFFEPKFDLVVDDMKQKKEFEDTIPIEETEKLFDAKKPQEKHVSLNDRLQSNRIRVGLNDRIAFVNKLFDFSQTAFNEVLRKLNSFDDKQQAINYIETQVKPRYNWQGQEELEERFMALIERRFI